MLVVVPKVLEREYEEEKSSYLPLSLLVYLSNKTVLLPLPHPLCWSDTLNSLS